MLEEDGKAVIINGELTSAQDSESTGLLLQSQTAYVLLKVGNNNLNQMCKTVK